MPKILDWHMKFNFGGPRSTSAIRNIFIHTTENDPSATAEAVADYQLRTKTGSYHELVDRAKVLIENTPEWVTWSTGNVGNDIGLHLSFVARAAMTRAQWMAEEANHGTLTRAARRVAKWCKDFNIPAVFVDGPGLLAKKRGVSTHSVARVWGGTDHWDPGTGFPMDHFLTLVNKELNPPPTVAEKETNTMSFTDADRKMLQRIHHELTHKFESRVDLANGKEPAFRDTAIGYALETDRKLELAEGTKLHAAFKEILDRLAAVEGKL